ncbi:MAG: glycosyltransferase family 39 protein [Candidatus Obscuribacter sp.]|nr:glycosyltransferase family 39 protein [Candidatus Obscuribacter sp.]
MNLVSVRHRTVKVAAPVLLLVSLFVAMLLLIGLSGNFPLNDDWSYGEGVRHLLRGHGLVMPTVCAPGIAHVALGLIASKIFGYSYTSLRLCSFVITFIGALALFDAAASLRIPRRDAVFIALVYAANPVLINVAFSFMSDSTGLALNMIFLACLLRAQAQKSVKMALLAFFFLLLAISVRQSALIFLALAPFCLSSNLASTKNRHLILAALFALPLVSAWCCDYWLTHRPSALGFVNHDYQMVRQSHAAVVNKLLTAPHQMILPTVSAMGQLLCYLALYTLPALVAFLWLVKQAGKWSATTIKIAVVVVLILLSSALLTVLYYHQTMPFAENIWRVTTIGAQGLLGIIRKPVPERRRMLLSIFGFVMTVP